MIFNDSNGFSVSLIKRQIIVLAVLLVFPSFLLPGQVRINEFLADNYSGLIDPDYQNRSDWIELANTGENQINLRGLFLTDDPGNLLKWALPPGASLLPGGYILIWADNRNTSIHANFRLNASGEFLAITTSTGVILDSLTFGPQLPDISYGRSPDGTGPFIYLKNPTPKQSNSGSASGNMAPVPVFSPARGSFNSPIQVILSTPGNEGTIRYTTDGSEPGSGSIVYAKPVNLTKTTVVKARLFREGMLPSPAAVHTYLINEPSKLPVFSISTDPPNLWDQDTGIYVEGRNYVWGWGNGNFWQDWEKECFVEFFESDREVELAQAAGMKIAGGLSRTASQKSLELIARGEYGEKKFDYRFFADKTIESFNKFKLRNAGNDWALTMMSDGMMQTLVAGRMDIDYEAYRPAILFLNGDYWGIHNIRETATKDYVEENHGFDKDNLDLLAYIGMVRQGDSIEYAGLMDYIKNHDLGEAANYSVVKGKIDIQEYINYNISQIYFANHDWPAGNIKFWRPRIINGLWRWILYDLDLAFLDFWRNTIAWATSEDPPYKGSTDLLRALMRNQEFRTLFLRTMQKHLNSTFQPDRVLRIIDSIQENIKAEMPRHIERWKGYHGWTFVDPVLGYIETPWLGSYPEWTKNVDQLRRFARLRPSYLNGFLMAYFGFDDTVKLKFRVDPPGGGRIWADQSLVIENELNTTYFKGQDLSIKAIPNPRFRFDGWEIAADRLQSVDPQITRRFDEDTEVIAHFSYTSEIPVLSVNEVMSQNVGFISGHLGGYDDWIEIYNPSEVEFDVAGLYLTDDQNDEGKWMVPPGDPSATTIPAKGFRIFWADGRPGLGCDHLGFKLSGGGEFVGLSLKRSFGFVWIDSLQVPEITENQSYGRYPDGSGYLFLFRKTPTPGSQNKKDPEIPSVSDVAIYPCYPLPFIEKFFIPFEVKKEINLRILVMDLWGNQVTVLTDQLYQPGKFQVEWDGRDIRRHRMPAGIYFITFETMLNRESFKTILLN